MQPEQNAPAPQPLNVNPEPQAQPQFQTAPAPQPQPAPTAPQSTEGQPQPQPMAQPQAQPTSPAPQPTVQGQPQGQAPAPAPAPAPQGQPQATPTPSATPDYDRLLESYLGKPASNEPKPLPQVPKTDDEAEITKFFEDFRNQVRDEAIQQATQNTLGQIRQLENDKVAEQNAWNAVFEKYPHVKDNPTIRNQLHTLRLGAMVSGSDADLTKVADAYFEPQTQQYQQGYQAANQNTYVQRSQHLTASNASTPPQNVNTQTAYEAMAQPGSAGTNAAMQHVQDLINQGRL